MVSSSLCQIPGCIPTEGLLTSYIAYRWSSIDISTLIMAEVSHRTWHRSVASPGSLLLICIQSVTLFPSLWHFLPYIQTGARSALWWLLDLRQFGPHLPLSLAACLHYRKWHICLTSSTMIAMNTPAWVSMITEHFLRLLICCIFYLKCCSTHDLIRCSIPNGTSQAFHLIVVALKSEEYVWCCFPKSRLPTSQSASWLPSYPFLSSKF